MTRDTQEFLALLALEGLLNRNAAEFKSRVGTGIDAVIEDAAYITAGYVPGGPLLLGPSFRESAERLGLIAACSSCAAP